MISYTEPDLIWPAICQAASRARRGIVCAWGWLQFQLWGRRCIRDELARYEQVSQRVHKREA